MRNRNRWMDRRHAYRVSPPNAVAQCESDKSRGLYSVHDLSRGGVALEGKKHMAAGAVVGLKLMIPGYDSMSLGGKVIRTTAGPHQSSRIAVGFSTLKPDDEDVIGNIIVGELARGSLPRCLIASASKQERKTLADRLTMFGVQVMQAATPVEVIHRLETTKLPIDSILIGAKVGDSDGVEFASFVAGAYPAIRRILLGQTSGRRAELARHVAHASLSGRWGADDLRMVLWTRTDYGRE